MGRKLYKVLVLFLCVVILHPLWLPLFGRSLIVKDRIEKADAAVILSGDAYFDREKKAIDLYKKGFTNKVARLLERENKGFDIMRRLFNSEMTQEEAYRKYFELEGVPRGAVILGESIATSTFDELKAAKGLFIKNNFKSMLLVTGDYHMRRALMTAKWILRGTGIEVYTATAYSKDFSPKRWWLHEYDIKGVILEYISICFYLVYHFMLGK